MNITARLTSAAGPGEILLTGAVADAADLGEARLEHRRLELRGRSEATLAIVLTLRDQVRLTARTPVDE